MRTKPTEAALDRLDYMLHTCGVLAGTDAEALAVQAELTALRTVGLTVDQTYAVIRLLERVMLRLAPTSGMQITVANWKAIADQARDMDEVRRDAGR